MHLQPSPRFTLFPRTKPLFAAALACAVVGLLAAATPTANAGQTSTLSVLHNFSGQIPSGEEGLNLPQVTPPFKASDGNYYGLSPIGGTYGSGYIYKITAAGAYSVFYTFHDDEDADPPVEQGDQPRVLIQGADGNFYGICFDGGLNDDDVYHNGGGTIWKVTLGGAYTKLYDFDKKGGNPDTVPAAPVAFLQASDGNFYGLTNSGGKNSGAAGTFFKFVASTKAFSELHDFTGTGAGIEPMAQLLDGKDGFFYSTTTNGGGPDNGAVGTIFKITTAGKTTTLHPFYFDDEDPDAEPPAPDSTPLILGKDGNLYGATERGGNDDYGTVYRCSTAGGSFGILHNFGGETDGGYPFGGVTQGSDGNFYTGLQYGFGETPDSDQLGGYIQIRPTNPIGITVIHKFSSGKESNPWEGASALTETATKGVFYGQTQGGPGEIGTLVKLTVSPGITSALTATATVGKAFTYHIVATFTPTAYTATGLPAGLSVNATNGTISGTPTKAGTDKVTISAKNTGGTTTATLTITVKAS